MKRILFLLWLLLAACPAYGSESALSFGRFGTVHLYQTAEKPSQVVLFVSGDGGWNLGVVDMARTLAGMDALVVGVDINDFLRNLAKGKEACSYPAADFEDLSKFVQKKLGFPDYRTPILVGYSSGATLVYVVLVQAPGNTFLGALSLGFCPDLTLEKPMCRGNGLTFRPGPKKSVLFDPSDIIARPWIAFQGTIDQVCSPETTQEFVKKVKNGELVLLPKVGHGFSVERNWLPQFKKAFARLTAQSPAAPTAEAGPVSDLPLVEVPAVNQKNSMMAFFASGDGGWASLDQAVGAGLAARGIPVVGLNCLKYFWKERTPDIAAKDLARVLRHYLAAWKKDRVLLAGYSFGADILPFLANRLPVDLRDKVAGIALIGLSSQANFEFHLTDWLGGSPAGLPTVPEIARLAGMPIVCVSGSEEKDSICPELARHGAVSIALPGAHHLGGDYDGIVSGIMNALGPAQTLR